MIRTMFIVCIFAALLTALAVCFKKREFNADEIDWLKNQLHEAEYFVSVKTDQDVKITVGEILQKMAHSEKRRFLNTKTLGSLVYFRADIAVWRELLEDHEKKVAVYVRHHGAHGDYILYRRYDNYVIDIPISEARNVIQGEFIAVDESGNLHHAGDLLKDQ